MNRPRGRAFAHAVAAAGAVLLVTVPELDATWVREHLWAFDHLRDVPRAVRVVLALALLTFSVPRVRRIPGPVWLRITLVFAASALLFWLFRHRNFELGDSALLIQLLTRFVHLQGYHVTYDEPLDLLLHSWTYGLTHETLGWGVEDAYALLSSIAGLGFLAVTWLLWRRCAADPVRRAIGLALVLSTASVQMFFGYVENYTLVALGLMVYVLLAWEYLEGRCRLFWPALALGTSLCLHVLAGWLFPSLLFLWLAGPGRRSGRGTADLFAAALGVALPVAATVGLLAAVGVPPGAVRDTHLAQLGFVFFVEPGSVEHQFTAFSLPHVIAQLNQLALVALPGLLAFAAALVFARCRIAWSDPFLGFLLVATGSVQLFASTWNPELGAYQDWDLFAVTGFFYALLGGYALVRFTREIETVRHVGGTIVILAFLLTASWVVSNSRRQIPLDPLHGDAHLRSGHRYVADGDVEGALREFKEALAIDPRNAEATLALAALLWEQGERLRARPLFEEFLEAEPAGPRADHVRALLGRARIESASP